MGEAKRRSQVDPLFGKPKYSFRKLTVEDNLSFDHSLLQLKNLKKDVEETLKKDNLGIEITNIKTGQKIIGYFYLILKENYEWDLVAPFSRPVDENEDMEWYLKDLEQIKFSVLGFLMKNWCVK